MVIVQLNGVMSNGTLMNMSKKGMFLEVKMLAFCFSS